LAGVDAGQVIHTRIQQY